MDISIVIPIYNDAELVEDFIDRFEQLRKTNNLNSFEVIFVNDGSSKSNEVILNETISRVSDEYKIIHLSRNFGQHIALSAGYKYAVGDYVCMLNVDMQDPPEEIFNLYSFIREKNLDVAYGLRETREDSFLTKVSSMAFNLLLNKLTGNNTPLNIATIRMMSRRFVNAYNSLTEKTRYLPGLEDWLGFEKGYIPVKHVFRKKGKSSYNFKKRLLMATESIISFSDLPLRMISIVGLILGLTGLLLTVFLIITKFFFVDFRPGYTSTISTLLLLGGFQISIIGLSSLYIGRILKEVQNRPLYIIKNTINIYEI